MQTAKADRNERNTKLERLLDFATISLYKVQTTRYVLRHSMQINHVQISISFHDNNHIYVTRQRVT